MRARQAVLTLVAVASVVVAVVALVRTARGFYRLDFPLTWVETGLRVVEAPAGTSAAAAGLQPGDLVVAINDVPVETISDPLFVLAAGDDHLVTVLDEAGELRQATLRPPPPDIDPVYLARTAVGAFGLACALVAVFLTRRREATTFVLLAATSLLVGAIPHRTAAAVPPLEVLHRLAGSALPFVLVRFFAVFPERRLRMWWWDLVTLATMTTAVVMTVVPQVEVWWSAMVSVLRVVFLVGFVAGLAVQLRRWSLSAAEARARRQIEWAALGLFVGLLPYVALVSLPQWLGMPFEPFSWLAVLPIAAVPLGFLAALAEYRLWDLEPISRDALSFTVIGVAGGLVFAVINHLLVSYGRGLGPLRNLLVFATGVLLVVALQPVRLQVERFLDQWLHRGRPTPRALLTASTRELAAATDPRELLQRLSETLREGLEFDLVATYLRHPDGEFRRATGAGDGLPERLSGATLQHAFPAPEEAPLERLGYALRLPLERVGTVHGLLYLGLRRGGFPLGVEGREVVTAFAAQAALGLESARRLDDLRRQAEEYRILHANTQRIIESSAAAILVCDASGRILSANTRAAGIFMLGTEDLVGETLDGLVDLPRGWQPQLPLHAVNAEAATLSEPPRQVLMAVSVLELDSGSFNGRVVVLQDVSELRDLESRLRDQERLAALGRLASGLAHEINTPLTGISSFAQMLGEMTPEGDPRARLVGKLVDQSFRVSRIVANLREAVRSTQQHRTPVDLREVVGHAAADAARSVGMADRVVIDSDGPPVMVEAAVAPVELAVSNLVRNALEASPGNTSVHVRVRASESWGEVLVDDSGAGVPEDLRDKVFEPFYSTKTGRGGTGLGLAITRDMIGQLGGEVRLESSPDGGARAIVRLKRWQAPAQSS